MKICIAILFVLMLSVAMTRSTIQDLTNARYYQQARAGANASVKAGKGGASANARGAVKGNTRPAARGQQTGFGSNNRHPCGEPQSVHETWVEARQQARLMGASGRDVAELTLEAIASAGLSGEQYACLAFEIAISENIEQCSAILFSREIGQRQGVEYDVATQWTENTVRRIYPWFRGSDVECGYEV